MNERHVLKILGVAFALTGGAALVIEQAFEKLLTTVIGSSVDAGAIVLGTYFLGMSIGAASFYKLRQYVGNGAILYAALEGFVGAFALFLGVFFSSIQYYSSLLISATETPLILGVARAAIAVLWIVPPTFAMGASFPAMVSWLRSQPEAIERWTSGFYTVNIVGAFVGAASAAYFLFPTYGMQSTLLLTGAAEIVLAGIVFAVTRRQSTSQETALPTSIVVAFRHPAARRALFAAFLSGFVVFAFEVLWLHLGGVVIGMSAYSFAAVLIVVLAGLFLGGTVATVLPQAPAEALRTAYLVAVGLTAVVYPLWDDIPGVFVLAHDFADSFWKGELVRVALLAVVVGVPSVGLGMVYPTVLRLPVEGVPRDGVVAALGLANGLGSISGALLVGFVLLSSVGSEGVYFLLVLVLAVVQLVGLREKGGIAHLGLASGFFAFMSLVGGWDQLVLTSGTNVYFSQAFVRGGNDIVFWHEDNSGGVTTVVRDRGVLTLLTNGKFQGNNAGEMVDQASFALVPVALTPGRTRAFVIGLGTGQSANAIAHAGFEHVEVAEIAKGMIQAAPLFAVANEDVLNRQNVSVHVGDGRNILLRSREKYDLVSMEISSLWFSGSVSLYSEEFYDLVEKRLAPNGVLQQWIQLHHMGTEELVSALVTARSVFSHVSLWVVGSQGVVIASNDELRFEPERLATPELQRIMALLTAHELSALEISRSRVLNPTDITRMAEYAKSAGIPKNTDANRWLEYWSPRYNLSPRNWMVVNLKWFHDFSTEPESKKALLETKKRLFDRQR